MAKVSVSKLLICSKIDYTAIYFKLGEYVGEVGNLGPGVDYTEECLFCVDEEGNCEFSL